MDVYGSLTGASAVAANGLVRYTLGAAFPLFTVQSKRTVATLRDLERVDKCQYTTS